MAFFEYDAVRTRQTPNSEWLITLSAPATEIDIWAGIPQKQRQGGEETLGFQRDESTARIAALKEFYADAHNIIQNPLLCAIRENVAGKVSFTKTADGLEPLTEIGRVKIEVEDLDALSLKELMLCVKNNLEHRIGGLAEEAIDLDLVAGLKRTANLEGTEEEETFEEQANGENVEEEEEDEEAATSTLFTDESHVYDFWQQLSARVKILEEGDAALAVSEEFLGYSREAMKAVLKPVVLVDGQHRLRGAVEAGRERTRDDTAIRDAIEKQIAEGENADEVQRKAEREASRRLPISLLTTADPAEHVFQFVVVNQKATPIGRALLGTIISTTLSNEELERVSDRLERAGIPLLESRAVAFLARSPTSPFCNLVEQGLPNESGDRLPWSVMRSLVAIFQHLKGGKLFHSRNDYVDLWKRNYLDQSGIVAEHASLGDTGQFNYWSSPDGPWRDVFIRFWSCVRDKFGETEDKQAKNFWGNPRNSQLFNKISLTILASDFFQFLNDKELAIDSVEQIPALVERWAKGVSENYFSRGWKIEGVKKDLPGIRKRWAKTWEEYRKNPTSLPPLGDYGKVLSE
jgi:hypothetical protein